jgi:hypothetical protein
MTSGAQQYVTWCVRASLSALPWFCGQVNCAPQSKRVTDTLHVGNELRAALIPHPVILLKRLLQFIDSKAPLRGLDEGWAAVLFRDKFTDSLF